MYKPDDIQYKLDDIIMEKLRLRYVNHPKKSKKIFDEFLMDQLRYDGLVESMKHIIELNKPFRHEIKYTQAYVIIQDICFIRTDISYNNAKFRIERNTNFPKIIEFIIETDGDIQDEDLECPYCGESRNEDFECPYCG